MEPKSQNTQNELNFKICSSCKRKLHFSLFGYLWNSKDGFNSICKDCRNFRRRIDFKRHYVRKNPPKKVQDESIIFPIDDHNRKVLSQFLDPLTELYLEGESTINRGKYQILLEQRKTRSGPYLFFQLKQESDSHPFSVESHTLHLERFIDHCLLILKEQCVRLADSKENEHTFWDMVAS